MTYDEVEQFRYIKEAVASLKPYCGRPTPGNETVDSYLSGSEERLGCVAEAVSDMNRAIKIAERAHFNMERCIDDVAAALCAHFKKHGEWDEKSAVAAVVDFEKHGFGRKSARALATFARGMFFDDSDAAFQSIRCIGLYLSKCKSFTYIGFAFEDAASGNHFALKMPFTPEEKRGWRTSFDFNVGDDIADMPCYTLIAPGKDDEIAVIAKSYDVREMRIAVAKFVAGGCLYRRKTITFASYKMQRFLGRYWN